MDESIGRRLFVGGVAALGGAALSGGLNRFFTPAIDSRFDQRAALKALMASLSAEQRRLVCFPIDDPTRQLDNTVPVVRRSPIEELLLPAQRALVRQLFASTLSARGQAVYSPLLGYEAGGLDGCVLAIYGEPGDAGWHAMINGPHLLMRTGSESLSGLVWNGPLAFGHQIGNGSYRLPGNGFVFQAEAANALYAALGPHQSAARVAKTPVEFVVQVQEADGRFDGVAISALDERARDLAHKLLDSVLDSFAPASSRAARAAIDHHGGSDRLHVAFYDQHGYYPDMTSYAELSEHQRRRRGQPFFQVFRIEGPGTLIHWRGYPHLHAYMQIAREPRRQHVGSTLAETERLLEGDALRALIQRALKAHSGAELAYYGSPVPSRFCPGPVTSGLVASLDPFDNKVALVTALGSELGIEAQIEFAGQGVHAAADKWYRIATTEYHAERARELGASRRVERDGRALREVLIDYVRRHGLALT
jgi:hypothetical protein